MKSMKISFLLLSTIFITQLSCDYNERTNKNDPKSPDYLESGIVVRQGDTPIASGTQFAFGSTQVSMPKTLAFVIENNGKGDLLLIGNPPIIISDDINGSFEITTLPDDIVPNYTQFQITFDPGLTVGEHTATVTIPCDDPDNSNFTITLNATCTATPEPEIIIFQGSTTIADGGSYDMGSAMQTTTLDCTFSIQNLGSADLLLSGDPRVSLSSGTYFSVTSQPNSPIFSGASTTFTIRFTPGNYAAGTKTVTVTINNTDSDENPYTFTLTATSTEFHGTKGVDLNPAATTSSLWCLGSTVYLCYVNTSNDLIFAASYNNGLTFTSNTVDSGVDCQSPSLKVLLQDDPTAYISYYDATNQNLKFVRSSNFTSWSPQTLDSTGDVGKYSSIDVIDTTLDFDTRVYISYYDTTNGNLKFITSDTKGNSWDAAIAIDSTGDVGQYTSLDTGLHTDGSTEKIGISYYDVTNGNLKFAYSTNYGSSFSSVTTIDSSADNVGQYSSLGFYNSKAYVAYYDATNGDVKLARYRLNIKTGLYAWSNSTILTTNISGDHLSLFIDSDEQLHLAYRQRTSPVVTSDLYYATSGNYGTIWTEHLVIDGGASTNSVGVYNDICTDGDRVYIATFSYNSLLPLGVLSLVKSIDGGTTW
jgi:hypothetical protein